MFSTEEKQTISSKIQKILRKTEHPELPDKGTEIKFMIRVEGAESWSWAEIVNNSSAGEK